jgi:hypothetical protein
LGLAAGTADGGAVLADKGGPDLRLVWFDPSDVASGSALVARAETANLLARMGVTVVWRRGAPGEMRRTDEVWVILVSEGPPAQGVPVLGATPKRHTFAPVAWVRVPNVRAAVGVSRSGSLLGIDQIRVGTALGRVIAHEVVHAVIPSVGHGRGLMSRSLDRRRLTAPSILVEPETALALQAALRGDPLLLASWGASVLTAAAEEKDR